MNKIIALSVLLLIGCSPASPDKSVSTIGRPEKKADSYPIPIGKLALENSKETIDFTDILWDEKGLTDKSIDRLVDRITGKESDKNESDDYKIFFRKVVDRKDQGTESIKGFWYKLDSNTIMLNYRAYRDDPDSPTNLNPILSWKLTVDRGDLFDTRNGTRWKRIKAK